MGFLGKVLPWKRKDELALDNNLGLGGFGADSQGMNLGMPAMPMMDQQMQGMPPQYPSQQQYPTAQPFGFPQQPQQPQVEAFQRNSSYERAYAAGKEMEVVSAKLDAIKAALETLNQRLASIERYIQAEQEFKKRGGW